jgi:hypothetical protein
LRNPLLEDERKSLLFSSGKDALIVMAGSTTQVAYSDQAASLLVQSESRNIKEVSVTLREFYMSHDEIKGVCSYSDLLDILHKDIQRSRYETPVINLAQAYDGYQFYLPVFMDFRGRIYRSGIFHFHERDLARSLITFANDSLPPGELPYIEKVNALSIATAFHYKSFSSYEDAYSWIYQEVFNEIVDHPAENDDFLFTNMLRKPKIHFSSLQHFSLLDVT